MLCAQRAVCAEVCVGDIGTKMNRFWAPTCTEPSVRGRQRAAWPAQLPGAALLGVPAPCWAFCAPSSGDPISSGLFRDVAQHSC